MVTFNTARNTNIYKICELHRAIFSSFYNIRNQTLQFYAFLGADYMDRASPVDRAEKCHENLPWAAK